MSIHRSLVLALIAGIVSAFVARAIPRYAPNTRTVASASPAPSDAAPIDDACKAERAELASNKAKLAICMAISMRTPKTAPSKLSETAKADPRESESPEIKRNRELLESDSEVVIVRRSDGTIGIYKLNEWSSNSDERMIGRKFPDGEFGWYARPMASTEQGVMFRGTSIELEPDGKLTMRGKPAPASVIRRLGGKVDEPDAN